MLLAEMLPAHWGSNPPFARWTNNWFEQPTNASGSPASGSSGPYYSQRFVLDEHTGTQTDFPAHFVPPPDSGLPHASPMGAVTGDKYPLSRLMGPAVVIDVTDLRDAAEPGFRSCSSGNGSTGPARRTRQNNPTGTARRTSSLNRTM